MRVQTINVAAPEAPACFVQSLHETGFAVLTAHSIAASLLDLVHSEWLGFFGESSKEGYQLVDGSQLGYFPHRPADPTPDLPARDRKEFFHVRPDGPYPTELTERALVYFHEAEALATRLLGWVQAECPSQVSARFQSPLPAMIAGSTGTTLRIQHYLPLTPSHLPGGIRALAHVDINLLTLLPAPREPGLQVRDVGGAWHDLPGGTGAIIVNAGEMLEVVSGGYFPATVHRVVNPPGDAGRGSRVSMPLFLHPTPDTLLQPGLTAAAFRQARVEALRERGWLVTPGGAPGIPARPEPGRGAPT